MQQIKKVWENSNLQSINRMDGRAYFVPYSSKKDYQSKNTNSMSLNGEWNFLYLDAPEYSPEGFSTPDFSTENFNKIPVPSCWQLHGYGKMRYIDELYPFHVDPPFVPVENPTGIYKRKFTLDGEWCKGRSIIRFHGVDSAYHLWVNGKEIGFAKISRLLSEFDITDAVQEGENDITVRVYQWSDGSYLEDQDMWWISGIFRDVEIINQPMVHINDIVVESSLNDDFSHAIVTAKVIVAGAQSVDEAGLSLELTDSNNKTICNYIVKSAEKKENSIHYVLCAEIETPKLWSAEEPNLYLTSATLASGEFVAIETGIRKIEVCGNQFLVNGKAIMLNGINRHDFNCKTGRTVSKEDMLWDVLTMKRHNINAVRTSHYPNHPYFYHLCNVYGLYVIDETDLECHGFMDIGYWNWLSNSKEWTKAYVARGTGMVKRDRNHPCIIMWSLGNESGFGHNFYQMANEIRALDNSRLLHYEGDYNSAITDVYSTMYTRAPGLEKIGIRSEEMPFIICEYCHSMGNGPGALKEHQDAFRRYQRMQGGFIWEWIDHGIECSDDNGKTFYKYGGDYGEFPHNSNFCMDGMVFPWREPSPALLEYKKVIQPIEITSEGSLPAIIKLTNRYDFLSLSHLKINWKCTANGVTIQEGSLAMPDGILAGQSEEIAIPLSIENYIANTEYRLLIELVSKDELSWAAEGHLIAWEDILLNVSKEDLSLRPSGEAIGVTETPLTLCIANKYFTAEFDRLHGILKSYSSNGLKQITDGIQMNFWRAPIDNDMYIGDDRKNKYFMHLFESRPYSLEWEEESDRVIVEIIERDAPITQAYGYDVSLKYIFYTNGDFSLSVNGTRVNIDLNAPDDLPKIGLEVKMSASSDIVTWYGRGPGENYIDSSTACNISRYTLPVAKMHTPYPFPQENGNRCDVRWAYVAENDTGLFITAKEPFNLTAHDYTVKELENAKHMNELSCGGKTIISLDIKNSGVGSNSCGQGPLEHHKAKYEDFHFDFEFRPCSGAEELNQIIVKKY